MAYSPERRVRASRQRQASDPVCGRDADNIPRRNQERFLECPLNSDAADEFFSEASVHSMTEEELEEDDLLDDEEEYRREMEDQRLSDVKNRHYEDETHPPIMTSASVKQAGDYSSSSSAGALLYQNHLLGENPCLEQVNDCESLGSGGDASSIKVGNGSVSVMVKQLFVENSMADETNMHACMGSGQTLNAKVDYSAFGSTKNQGNIPYFMEKKQLLTAGCERLIEKDLALLDPAEIRSMDLLPAALSEETFQLDLSETRTLVDQPAILGSASAQVTSLLDHPLINNPSPFNSQPTHYPINP